MGIEGGKASSVVRSVAASCPRSWVALRIKSSSSAKFRVLLLCCSSVSISELALSLNVVILNSRPDPIQGHTRLMVLLVSALSRAQTNQFPMFPNPILMPRDVLTSDASVVCVTGYASSARKVPKSLKRTVFLSYGITKRPSDWEVDHLVSLELGGSNSIKNLWSDGVVA